MNNKQKIEKKQKEKEDLKKISPDEFDSMMKKILSAPPIEKKKEKKVTI